MLRLIAEGLTNLEISQPLYLSEDTGKTQIGLSRPKTDSRHAGDSGAAGPDDRATPTTLDVSWASRPLRRGCLSVGGPMAAAPVVPPQPRKLDEVFLSFL